MLQEWLAIRPASPHQAIFLNERGQPLSGRGIQWLLGRYSQQLGFKVTPHQLRHTFARQLTEAGMPLASLSQLLGHSQLSTTQIYTAGADPQLAQAYQQAMAQLQASVSAQAPSGPPQLPVVVPTLSHLSRRPCLTCKLGTLTYRHLCAKPAWICCSGVCPVGKRNAVGNTPNAS